MTRAMKRLVTLGVLVAVLGVAGTALAPAGVEAQQPMTAGVAKGVITNDTPRVMVNGRVSEGTKEDIYARVLVLNDGSSRLERPKWLERARLDP